MAEGRQPYHSGNVELYESLRQPVLARLREDLQGAPDTCSVCAKLCECAAEFDPEVRIRYGFGHTLDGVLALDCTAHRPFFAAFRAAMDEKTRHFHAGADADALREARAQWPARYQLGVELRGCILYVGWGNLGRRVPMEMVRRPDIPDHPGAWTPVQSPRVDLELIQSWRRHCALVHGDACANPWNVPATKPLWLIDTHQRCLVPGEEADSYVCLSYRRGATAVGFQTTRASLPDLQSPGRLDDPAIAPRLPRVVADALHLVRDLDERYLWVDTLCIPRDDEDAQTAEIARMGHIYGGAALTVVAAEDGDDVGLPGVTDAAPARLTSQMLLPLGGERLLAFQPTPGLDARIDTAYDGRAWTFQEYELAGRRLVFAGHRVQWVCPRQKMDEWRRPRRMCYDAQCRRHNPPRGGPPRLPSLTVRGLPDLWAYGQLTRRCNGRALTDPADAPRAVAGLLTVLARGFPGGFLWGLPVMFLDAALCWRPAAGGRAETGQVTRRHVVDAAARLPSWSWLAWQGPVQCCHDEDGFMPSASDTAYQTHAITTWYSARRPSFDARDNGPLSSWFRNRPAHCDPDGPLPPGWRRLHLDTPSEAPRIGFERPPAGCGRYVFAHETLPYQYFWYHFALPTNPSDVEETTPSPPSLSQPPYLLATTVRLRLEAYHDPALAMGPGRPRPTVGLRDARGRRVGHLWLHAVDDLARFPTEEDGEGTRVELVAVCRRESAQVPKLAFEVVEFYKDHYGVLWVEWEDGIAYRRASGVVERGAWDDHPDQEEVDLVLG